MSENTPEAPVVTAPSHVQCEPGGTVYCDDYEAITGVAPAADQQASVIATKVVTPDSTVAPTAEVPPAPQVAPVADVAPVPAPEV